MKTKLGYSKDGMKKYLLTLKDDGSVHAIQQEVVRFGCASWRTLWATWSPRQATVATKALIAGILAA